MRPIVCVSNDGGWCWVGLDGCSLTHWLILVAISSYYYYYYTDCMQLAQNAVHGAMAGFTGFSVGLCKFSNGCAADGVRCCFGI